jgi:hypothetical protein
VEECQALGCERRFGGQPARGIAGASAGRAAASARYDALAIKARNGTSTTAQLKGDAPVIVVEKGAMSDIKDNSFVGITALAQPDGTIKAVEVHVFAEPLRGAGEGHYPWDLMPNGTTTNAAVA